ncbi:MAG: ATP synthase F1 subunit gamma [Bacteroidota bacterium]
MASLRDIRNRIGGVKNTQQVTRAMKMVAAAKLRRAQENIFQTRPYAYKLNEITTHLRQHLDPTAHPLFQARDEVDNVLLIIVTADRGLAGAFNTNVIKTAEQTIKAQYADKAENGNLYLVCVGKKGHEYFERRGYQLVGDFRGAFDKVSVSTVQKIGDVAVDGFMEGRWDKVDVVYNEFKNTISQNRIVEPLLPITDELFLTPLMEGTMDEEDAASASNVDYIFEPDPEGILEILVPRFLNYELWRILLESNAAEQGARMVAMDNATTNAQELLRDLKLQYNRARQDAITKELIEITSGADALS